MRFTLDVPDKYEAMFWRTLLPVIGLKLVVFYFMHSFHGWWRHVNFSDLISLAKSAAIATLGLIAMDSFVIAGQIPRMGDCQ